MSDFFLEILLYYNMLEIKIIHLCYNDTQYIQYHNTVFRLGLRNLLPTEATVTWEKWVIASGKLQTDATASPNPPPTHQLISVRDAHISAWDVLAHWYLRTLAPLPLASLIELILSRGKPSSTTGSQEGCVTYRPLMVRSNHYQLFLKECF